MPTLRNYRSVLVYTTKGTKNISPSRSLQIPSRWVNGLLTKHLGYDIFRFVLFVELELEYIIVISILIIRTTFHSLLFGLNLEFEDRTGFSTPIKYYLDG